MKKLFKNLVKSLEEIKYNLSMSFDLGRINQEKLRIARSCIEKAIINLEDIKKEG